MEDTTTDAGTNINYPGQSDLRETIGSLTKILSDIPRTLTTLRREFRGEALYTDDEGESHWVQVSKPIFIKIDTKTRDPIMIEKKFPNGETRKVYIPNDEAIDEVISMIKFMGVNTITSITKISNDNVLDDLKEFECKLASVLALKQVEWGLDKELLPMLQTKIKTLVQDARYLAENGNILKALQTSVQRIEQAYEGERLTKQQKQFYQ